MLRLLSPAQRVPSAEILRGWLIASPRRTDREHQGEMEWQYFVEMFVAPTSRDLVVFPSHRCHFFLEAPGVMPRTVCSSLSFAMKDGPLVQRAAGTLLVEGPGLVSARCYAYTAAIPGDFFGDVLVSAEFWGANSEKPMTAETSVPFHETQDGGRRRWQVGRKKRNSFSIRA